MNAPQWFIKAIAILDPLLTVRRSEVSNHWVIERTAVIPPSEVEILRRRTARIWRWVTFPNEEQKKQIHKNRIAWQAIADELKSAEVGKRVICRPRDLTTEVYDGLCRSDFRRYGGYARFCNDLEAGEERYEADQERVMSNKRRAVNGEVYSILEFLDRKQSEKLNHGHQDMSYLLHGKHSKPGDAPLIQLSDF